MAGTEEEADHILLNQLVDIVLLGNSLGDRKLQDHIQRFRKAAGDALLLYCCKYEERRQLIEIEHQGGVDGIVVRPFFLSTLCNTIAGIVSHGETNENVKGSVLNGMKFLCAGDNELNAEILSAILDIKRSRLRYIFQWKRACVSIPECKKQVTMMRFFYGCTNAGYGWTKGHPDDKTG